jgi:DNA-binding response OmpR family regulator
VARILVIDDDPAIRGLLRAFLRRTEHEVLLAADGGEGIALFREQRPDLIVTDIFMPEKDGLALILEIAAESDVRVIAISGGGDHGILDYLGDAPEFGAWKTLAKPFSRPVFLGVVEEALQRRGDDEAAGSSSFFADDATTVGS